MRSTTIRPSCFALRRTYDRHLAADRGVVRAAMDRTLQVVLGEAEPDDGFLRFVLEGEGFDIVGMASTDDELERVLRGARPDVIVLDAGISATAALEAKEQANGAALVVIWPGDVVAAIADEHVEPHLVVDDLGPAVRSASRRARPREERVVIPDTIDEVIDRWREAERGLAAAAPPEEARLEPPRLDRSTRGVLVAALTWILGLTTLATIDVGGSDGSGEIGSGGDEQSGSEDQGNQDQGNEQQGDGEQGNQDQGNDQQGDGGSQQQDDQGGASSDDGLIEGDQGSEEGSGDVVASIA